MSRRRFVPAIGLVGGVGSGKSSVARALGRRRPVVVLDGDAAGHRALTETAVKEQIRRRFGPQVFDEAGEVDRRALGRQVFGSTVAKREARAELEQIVHPRIREQLETGIARARSDGEADAVLVDAAVLFEAGWDDLCDAVVFVDVPADERLRRVESSRGWTAKQFAERESSQYSVEQKRTASQYVIDNSGPVDEAASQLERIVDELRSRQA